MNQKKIIAGVATILLCASISACGSSNKTRTQVRTTTVLQELTDLKKALDSGAINQKEYEEQKRRILDRK